jgi:hypothetical protein
VRRQDSGRQGAEHEQIVSIEPIPLSDGPDWRFDEPKREINRNREELKHKSNHPKIA